MTIDVSAGWVPEPRSPSTFPGRLPVVEVDWLPSSTSWEAQLHGVPVDRTGPGVGCGSLSDFVCRSADVVRHTRAYESRAEESTSVVHMCTVVTRTGGTR